MRSNTGWTRENLRLRKYYRLKPVFRLISFKSFAIGEIQRPFDVRIDR